MNIFEIQQPKQDKEFVLKNGSLEFVARLEPVK